MVLTSFASIVKVANSYERYEVDSDEVFYNKQEKSFVSVENGQTKARNPKGIPIMMSEKFAVHPKTKSLQRAMLKILNRY